MQDAKSIWEMLGAIPIGTIVLWFGIAATIVGCISAAAIKLFKYYDRFKNVKDEKEQLKSTVTELNESIGEIRNEIKALVKKQEEQEMTTILDLRYTLVTAGERARRHGKITSRELAIFMEQYDRYENVYHQNSYVHTLKEIVEKLPVVDFWDERQIIE